MSAVDQITEGVTNLNIVDSGKRNRIQVSNTKKPLFFYVNLAKRYMQQHNEVELSALGMESIVVIDAILVLILIGSLGNNLFVIRLLTSDPLTHHWWEPFKALAISTVVTIAEILKNNGLAVEKKITTSTVDIRDDARGRPVQKAKIEILLGKTEDFDKLMAAAAAEEIDVGDHEEQN